MEVFRQLAQSSAPLKLSVLGASRVFLSKAGERIGCVKRHSYFQLLRDFYCTYIYNQI